MKETYHRIQTFADPRSISGPPNKRSEKYEKTKAMYSISKKVHAANVQ